MQHDISISVINNSVGQPQQSNGIMMLFMQAVAVAGTFSLNQPYLITSPTDAANLGINAAYDTTNGTAVFQQINEYYNEGGTGKLLWIVGVPLNTAYAAYVASATFDAMIAYTAQADPANRAKIIGLCYAPPTTLQSATDFPADVLATLPALQAKYLTLFALGYQFSAVVDGYNMSSTVTPATIGTLATMTNYAISLCITGTQPNGVSAVGLCLGRFSKISIGHGLGAVADGSVNTTTAYLTNSIVTTPVSVLVVGHIYTVFGGVATDTVVYNGVTYTVGESFTAVAGHTSYITPGTGYLVDNVTPVQNLTPTYIDQLGEKQYLFLRTWFAKSGFFWNDGATAEASNLALSSQEYNRVANALSADALQFFIEQMGSNLPLDKSTGAVAQGWLNTKQQEFYAAYIVPLIQSGDITDAALTVTGPNFLATKQLLFSLEIEPTVVLGGVTGTVQFTATL